MKKIKWELWIRSFPFTCDSCKAGHWETRKICENCGAEETIRFSTKEDYKLWKEKK